MDIQTRRITQKQVAAGRGSRANKSVNKARYPSLVEFEVQTNSFAPYEKRKKQLGRKKQHCRTEKAQTYYKERSPIINRKKRKEKEKGPDNAGMWRKEGKSRRRMERSRAKSRDGSRTYDSCRRQSWQEKVGAL